MVTQDTAFVAFFDIASRDTTGIAPVANPADFFTLAPNPASGKVTLTIARPGSRNELVVCDAAGREVMRKEFSIVNCQFSIPLDLSDLPAGAYFVTLSTPTASATQRLVVR